LSFDESENGVPYDCEAGGGDRKEVKVFNEYTKNKNKKLIRSYVKRVCK
jgi:hypothetical protein